MSLKAAVLVGDSDVLSRYPSLNFPQQPQRSVELIYLDKTVSNPWTCKDDVGRSVDAESVYVNRYSAVHLATHAVTHPPPAQAQACLSLLTSPHVDPFDQAASLGRARADVSSQ